MTNPRQPNPPMDPQHLRELLADQATQSLSGADAEFVEGASREERDAMDLAAAAATEALLAGESEPLPAGLRANLQDRAAEFSRTAAASSIPISSPATPRRANYYGAIAGWLAAAAALALALYAWTPRSARVTPPEQQRQTLLAEAPDTTTTAWAPWGDDPMLKQVQGDVVWSASRQAGYLRFRNLAPNDPKADQYQLWIVDASRGEPLKVPPVDGGVFDIPASGEVVVPITAKLPVGKAVAFAVTREPPGGVVVSDQSRKVLVAMVK